MTALTHSIRFRCRFSAFSRLMAMRSRLAMAKFLGHFLKSLLRCLGSLQQKGNPPKRGPRLTPLTLTRRVLHATPGGGVFPPPSLVPPQKEPEKPRLCPPVSSVRGFSIIDPPPSGPDQSPPSKHGQGRRGQGEQLPTSDEQVWRQRRQIGGGIRRKRAPAEASAPIADCYGVCLSSCCLFSLCRH